MKRYTMIDEVYKNRIFYYKIIKKFINNKITATILQKKFLRQRSRDLKINNLNGYSEYYNDKQWLLHEIKFREEYFWKLYNYTINDNIVAILNSYVKAARIYNIMGEHFFSGIYDDISVNIRDYTPRIEGQWFDEKYDIDEEELRKRLTFKFKILEENKDLWEFDTAEKDLNKQNQMPQDDKNESAIGKIIGKIKGIFDGVD